MEGSYEGKEMSLSLSQADAKIQGMLAEQMATGSMDSEPDAFRAILKKMHDSDLTPTEAVAEAVELVASRQDYH